MKRFTLFIQKALNRFSKYVMKSASALYLKVHSLPLFRNRIEEPLLRFYKQLINSIFTIRKGKIFNFITNFLKGIARLYRYRLFRIFVYIFGFYFVLLIISACMLPSPLFKNPYSAVLLSSEGELLAARIASDYQWRFPLSEKLPYRYRTALVAFEDKRFYYHPGIDPVAIIRAAYINMKNREIVSGGSTISMQVIRMALGNQPRTFFQKTKEIFLSLGLELCYSKNEIASLYASHAPFGGNVIGFETATWRYFGRNPETLSWAECALLAVLPNNPSFMHPGRNRKMLKKKRDFLLEKLYKKGYLSEMDFELSQKEPLPLKPYPLPHYASHLLTTLVAKNENNLSFFHSTLKFRVQKRVATLVDRYCRQYSRSDVRNIAALVVDNINSEVIAYIGNNSIELSSSAKDRNGSDIDMIQRPRSTGSILKPVLYAAMLKDGELGPSTLVPDVPTHYGGYAPENFDRKYRGAVSAKDALTRSLNVPAVGMLKQYQLHRFYHFLKDLGMTTLFRPAEDYGLTLILGGAEGKLIDLTRIYAFLAQIAESRTAQSVKLLIDEESCEKNFGNLTRGPAYLTMQAMLEVVRPDLEGYWRAFSSSQKIGWKTGTSYGQRDAWAIGCTPRYTVGVWVGNADGEGKPGLLGVSYAAPVMFEIFSSLEKSRWFKEPHEDLKTVSICAKSGYLATELCESKIELLPRNSHFYEICPYHILVHLDKSRKWQVHSACAATDSIIHQPMFILPSIQEYYYRKHNSDYRKLPPMRPDCVRMADSAHKDVMSLIYPSKETKIFIPIGIEGKKSEAIFKATHREPGITIFWHIDGTYLGSTKLFHQMSVRPEPGQHTLTLVDQHGNRIEDSFEVLGEENTDSSH